MGKHKRGVPGPKMVKDKINPHQHSMNPDRQKGENGVNITSIAYLGYSIASAPFHLLRSSLNYPSFTPSCTPLLHSPLFSLPIPPFISTRFFSLILYPASPSSFPPPRQVKREVTWEQPVRSGASRCTEISKQNETERVKSFALLLTSQPSILARKLESNRIEDGLAIPEQSLRCGMRLISR